MADAPEWPVEGESVRIVRKSLAGRVDHERTATVTKRTPKRVMIDSMWFRLVGSQWHMAPRYIDYTTTLERVELPNA